MTDCAVHAGRDAVGRCAGCGKPLCEECVETTDESGVYCYDCAVSSQLAVLAGREKKELEAGGPATAGKRRRRFSTPVIVALVVIALLIAAEVTFLLIWRSGRKPPQEVGATRQMVYERDRCAMAMQEVRDELEARRKKEGAYPESLDQMAEDGGSTGAACPLTGAPYEYENRGSDYHLACPNPGRHGVQSLSATSTSIPHAIGE